MPPEIFFSLGLRSAPASENSRIIPGGEARRKTPIFFTLSDLGTLFFFLFYCLCTIPNPTISQEYSSYRSGHFHTYKRPFWMDTGLFSNRFLTFPSKSCTKKRFKPGKDRWNSRKHADFKMQLASSKQSIPSKFLSKVGQPKKISAKSIQNWRNGSKNKILAPS